ncbi:MAG: OmpA family protein, partial [Calditrichia bacterium]
GLLGVGIKGGFGTYFGDLNDRQLKPHYGFSVDYWLTDYYSMGVEAGFTDLGAETQNAFFKTEMFYLGADLKFKLLRFGNVNPYLMAGAEGFKFDPKNRNDVRLPNNIANRYDRFQIGAPVGTGVAFFLNNSLSLDFQGLYHFVFTDYLDDINVGKNDGYITTGLKLTFYFGGRESDKDTDGDGFPDKIEVCPDRAEDFDGYQDEDGCPDYDNDEDEIPDSLDQCPNRAEDVDKFMDDDGCPDPDNDGDGIPDVRDNCPGTDETVQNGTDTQEDMDGYQDDDGCPDPDNDGDGIPDTEDKCPDQPETFNGWEDEDGCPDQVPEVKMETEKAVILKGVYFRLGRAELDPNSEDILDQVVSTLRDNPQIEVEIRGYTDSTGTLQRNMQLSRERAQTVKQYLVKHGIDAARLQAFGFGPQNPIAPNETTEGRARNRRIEFYRTK